MSDKIFCASCGADITTAETTLNRCYNCPMLEYYCSGKFDTDIPFCRDCCEEDMYYSIQVQLEHDPYDIIPVSPDDDNDLIGEW